MADRDKPPPRRHPGRSAARRAGAQTQTQAEGRREQLSPSASRGRERGRGREERGERREGRIGAREGEREKEGRARERRGDKRECRRRERGRASFADSLFTPNGAMAWRMTRHDSHSWHRPRPAQHGLGHDEGVGYAASFVACGSVAFRRATCTSPDRLRQLSQGLTHRWSRADAACGHGRGVGQQGCPRDAEARPGPGHRHAGAVAGGPAISRIRPRSRQEDPILGAGHAEKAQIHVMVRVRLPGADRAPATPPTRWPSPSPTPSTGASRRWSGRCWPRFDSQASIAKAR